MIELNWYIEFIYLNVESHRIFLLSALNLLANCSAASALSSASFTSAWALRNLERFIAATSSASSICLVKLLILLCKPDFWACKSLTSRWISSVLATTALYLASDLSAALSAFTLKNVFLFVVLIYWNR